MRLSSGSPNLSTPELVHRDSPDVAPFELTSSNLAFSDTRYTDIIQEDVTKSFNSDIFVDPSTIDSEGPVGESTSLSTLGNGHSTKLNGISITSTNGSTSSLKQQAYAKPITEPVGKSIAPVNIPGTRLYDNAPIDREEFVRLVIQSLRDVGYIESAATLEAESGYTMEVAEVTRFRECILSADWGFAESYLNTLGVLNENTLRMAKYLISEQKYLELLERQSVNAALHILRTELASLSGERDIDQLHSLSALIMCSSPEDLRTRARWDGAAGTSRTKLLSNLQQFISPSIMIPQRRFSTILEQAFLYQRTNCLYHNAPFTPETFSLYSDHHCTKELFPLSTSIILKHHSDEVWILKWSNDGRFLATAGKDKTAIIWYIGSEDSPEERTCSMVRVLDEHEYTVGCLSWSPDDSMLLTSTESTIKVWNAKTGLLIQESNKHDETVSAIEWLPDKSGLLSGGMDRKICYWDMSSREADVWLTTSIRVTDLAIAPDFSRVVLIGLDRLSTTVVSKPSSMHEIHTASGSSSGNVPMRDIKEFRLVIYDYATRKQEASIRLEGELTSVKISQDSRYALVNQAPDEIQLWDLEHARLARKFTGQRQGRHVIRSCFGGVDGNFIVSGSEDGKVYVWHRDTGALLEMLTGHGDGSVNDVAWNPHNERMFASCSDDKTVRIWESPLCRSVGNEDSQTHALNHNRKGKERLRERSPWYDTPAGLTSSSRSIRGDFDAIS